jgi:phage tail sheath gpL-like
MALFNTIPGNLVAPLITFEVNSGGQFENRSRLLLIGHKNSGGLLAENVPAPCPTVAEARRLAGAGSMLDDMVRLARLNAPAQEIWIMAVPASGTASVRTLTVNPAPDAGQGAFVIAGQVLQITVETGDTVTDVATAIAAAINTYFDQSTKASLPYTATSTAGVVSLTARHAGVLMEDIVISVPTLDGGNVFSGKVAVGSTTAGSGSPDLSTGIAALGDAEFDWIVSPFSDATNIGRYSALLSDVSGRWAWNRQIYGHVFYPLADSIANLTSHGLAKDDRHLTIIPTIKAANAPHPTWQWAAAFAARIVPWLSDGATGNVARNQTGLVVEGIDPPLDRTGWPDYATRDAFLGSGLSTWKVNTGGDVVIDKIITTARTFNDVPDTTFRDIQTMGQLVYALRRFRTDLTVEHGQKSIADDNPANLAAISTVKDIKATFMHSYERMVRTGVLGNAVRAAEIITVERNPDNPNRVDIMAPLEMVKPLDIIAANAAVYSRFR